MVSGYVIMKIGHLKREHDSDCGAGSFRCDCGAADWNKEVEWIINEINRANAAEYAAEK